MTAPAGDPGGDYDVSELNRLRQVRRNALYDRATVHAILDAGLVAHVAFTDGGRPLVVPMIYGRDGDRLFLHGARKGRFAAATGHAAVCVAVTHVDGLVVARSLFDSSMNYRSAVLHGHAQEISEDERRLHALRCIAEHGMPGRWSEVRAPSA